MTNFRQVKLALFITSLALAVLVNSQDAADQSNKKNVSLQDPSVDETVKSALENGSVSEVVVRKDLLLFPVNAPNLVIAHTQEIHAVPQTNGTNTTDGKPTAAEVKEVNEYSLSQLVSTNDTDYDNETKSESSPLSPIAASTLLRGPQNASVLEPGKLLEIVSGFNLSHGLATETVPLSDAVQNISIPKQSITGLLSKSIQQSDVPVTSTLPPLDLNAPEPDPFMIPPPMVPPTPLYPSYGGIAKRSVELKESNSSDDSTALPPYPYLVRKRSVDSDESDSDDDSDDSANQEDNSSGNESDTDKRSIDFEKNDNDNSSAIMGAQTTDANQDASSVGYETTSTSSTVPSTGLLDNVKLVRRSVDLDEQDNDTGSPSAAGSNYYDYKISTELSPAFQVGNALEKLDNASTTNNSTSDNQTFSTNNGLSNGMHSVKEKLRDDSPENMEVAEDIVFRPLFRYRQETRLRQESAAYRRSGYRKSAYNSDDSNYDNGDYD